MIGNKYLDKSTNSTITVISSSNGIVLLSNGEKIDEGYLVNNSNYVDVTDGTYNYNNTNNSYNNTVVNPDTFMKSGGMAGGIASALSSQISKINTSQISDNVSTSTKVEIIDSGESYDKYANESYLAQDLEEEKREMLAKIKNYKEPKFNFKPEEDEDNDGIDNQPQQIRRDIFDEIKDNKVGGVKDAMPSLSRKERKVGVNNTEYIPENPLLALVKQAKKVNKFKANIAIDTMLPKYDLIKMFEESYDLSIIDILADEIIDSILDDRDAIREKIKSEIKAKVYNKQKTTRKPIKPKNE